MCCKCLKNTYLQVCRSPASGKKKSKSEQIAVGLSSFPRTRLDRSDSSTVWSPPKRKNKTKKDFATKCLSNQHKRYTERLFTVFIVLSFLCLFGFFLILFFSLKACQLGSDLSRPLKRYLRSASRARARRLHGSAVRGSEPIRLRSPPNQPEHSFLFQTLTQMSRVLPTSLRPEFPRPSNNPRIPDLGVMTTGKNARLKRHLRQRLQCKTGGSRSNGRAAKHDLPSTSLISLHFHKPSGYNSSPKTKERTKRNLSESAVGQPLMAAAWRSLSLKTAGWHGSSDAHVCCWRGKVLLYVSFTFTTAADNGSDCKTLITQGSEAQRWKRISEGGGSRLHRSVGTW